MRFITLSLFVLELAMLGCSHNEKALISASVTPGTATAIPVANHHQIGWITEVALVATGSDTFLVVTFDTIKYGYRAEEGEVRFSIADVNAVLVRDGIILYGHGWQVYMPEGGTISPVAWVYLRQAGRITEAATLLKPAPKKPIHLAAVQKAIFWELIAQAILLAVIVRASVVRHRLPKPPDAAEELAVLHVIQLLLAVIGTMLWVGINMVMGSSFLEAALPLTLLMSVIQITALTAMNRQYRRHIAV